MSWRELLAGARQTVGTAETNMSRRDMLRGLGAIAACAVAGPALLRSDEAAAVELLDDDDDSQHDLLEEVSRRRYRGRRRRRRRGGRHWRGRRRHYRRRRRRPTIQFHFRSSPGPRRGGSRYDYWHRRCVQNWGYSNPNYRGCMRYYGFY